MTTEERVAKLAEHGIGCPQAVKLGGPASIEAWCEQMETGIEAAAAEAETAEAIEAEAAASAAEEAEAATEAAEARAAEAIEAAEAAGGVEIETTPADGPEDGPGLPGGALEHVLTRLDNLEAAVDALAAQGPPVEAVEAVAASPEPKGKGKKKGKGK